MNRRTILKYTALATGAAVSAPLASILLSGCRTKSTDTYEPQFFLPKEFDLIKKLADLILPKTDSPSATDVGVHRTIDQMIQTVYKEEDKAKFKTGFMAFTEHLTQADFLSLKEKEQLRFLQKLELSKSDELKDLRETFTDIKQQTIAYYLSTEEISTNFLNYLPVPGKYEPCISLEEVGGKKWAL